MDEFLLVISLAGCLFGVAVIQPAADAASGLTRDYRFLLSDLLALCVVLSFGFLIVHAMAGEQSVERVGMVALLMAGVSTIAWREQVGVLGALGVWRRWPRWTYLAVIVPGAVAASILSPWVIISGIALLVSDDGAKGVGLLSAWMAVVLRLHGVCRWVIHCRAVGNP